MNTDMTLATRADMRNIKPRVTHLLDPMPHFQLHASYMTGRAEVETYIARKFSEAWQAEIEQFLPLILSMSCMGRFSAAVGLRCAVEEDLYLENYLEKPVEQEIAQHFRQQIERGSIIEIGNLSGQYTVAVVYEAKGFPDRVVLR